MNPNLPPTRGATLDELRDTDGSMVAVRPVPQHTPTPTSPAHTWGELSIPASVAIRRERIARPRPRGSTVVEEPRRGLTLAAHDMTNPLMATITAADLARFDGVDLQLPTALTSPPALTMPSHGAHASSGIDSGLIGAPPVLDDDSWSDDWDEFEVDEGWVDGDDSDDEQVEGDDWTHQQPAASPTSPDQPHGAHVSAVRSKLHAWLVTASRDLEAELSALYADLPPESSASATTTSAPVSEAHAPEMPTHSASVPDTDAIAPARRDALRTHPVTPTRPIERGVTRPRRRPAAAGEMAYAFAEPHAQSLGPGESADTPSMATAIPMPPPLPPEARASVNRVTEARRRIAALKTSTAEERARRDQESTGAYRLNEPDRSKSVDARAAALQRPR